MQVGYISAIWRADPTEPIFRKMSSGRWSNHSVHICSQSTMLFYTGPG